jgi:tetratricopeptide (TPR) repeat protein
MTLSLRVASFSRFLSLTSVILALPAALSIPSSAAQAASAAAGNAVPDRSAAYYHYGLAHLYEEMAVNAGRSDYATQAVEEYKLALNGDPDSRVLQDGLADLYFKINRIKDAVTAAQEQIKKYPDDVQAHSLLGKVYLRSLGDMQGAQASEMLQLAIGEYETIARLKPNDIETKLLLGQLYGLNHDSAKAEAQFKEAQKIDADSEEVLLNMARLYTEEGDPQRAADTLAAVPVTDRSARMEFVLGASYDQLKKTKDAIAAYRRSLDQEPDNPDVKRALATALLTEGKLDEALAIFKALVQAEPQDAQSQVRISDIQRQQGHYEDALVTLAKAKALVQDPLELMELSYNEALTYDALGKYDQATGALTASLTSTAHPDGKYSEQEKANRAQFLDRLGIIYREENKTTEAVAAYKEIAGFGGEYATTGYQGEVDSYRDAHMWKEATAVAAEAAKALPKDRGVQMMYAGQLADMGEVEKGLALAKAQLSGVGDDRDVETGLAMIYMRLKRYKESNEQLDLAEAASTKPNEKLYIYYLRGTLFDREKMYAEAEVQYRKALAINPQYAGVLNDFGYMLADRGDKLPEALQMIRKAVELDPQNGAYLDSLGWVYYKTGQYSQAEETLRKANERINTDPTVHDHLGEVYEKTGKLKMAVAQWERSMTEYANSLPADADPADVSKVQHKLENARVKLAKLNTSSSKETK